jgi:hypothetical protein
MYSHPTKLNSTLFASLSLLRYPFLINLLSVCHGTSRNDSSYVIVYPVDFGGAVTGVGVTSAGFAGRCLRENSVDDMLRGPEGCYEEIGKRGKGNP